MKTFICLGTISLLLSPCPAYAGEAPALRWQFRKGQVHKYLFKHKEIRTVNIAGKEFETTTNTEMEWIWTVQDVDDKGVATLEQKLTALRVSSTGKDFQLEYDSSKANRADGEYRKKLINLYDQIRFAGAYSVRLRPDGAIEEMRGWSKVLQDHDPGMNIIDFHALNWRDDSFGWFLGQALGRLPDADQVKQGRWKVTVDKMLAGLGPLMGHLEFTLKKPVREEKRVLQVIGFAGSQNINLDMKWLNLLLQGKLQTTKLQGSVRFDAKTGMVEGSRVEAAMTGDLKFNADNNPTPLQVGYQHTLELQALR